MKQLNPEKFLNNKYNHLLCALILLFVISPSLEVRDRSVNFPIAPLILMVVLVTAVRADFRRGPFFNAFMIFALVSFVLDMFIYFLPESRIGVIRILKFISGSISVSFYSVTVYILSKRLFRVRKVTADTIKGGISAYLLIGFIFATIYGLLVQLNPNTFLIASDKEMMFLHFSFTTLTTLGYGDIVPNGRYAAVLTNSEAIIGQLYLTVFVARLVGLYVVGEAKA
jgi:hypothetical protein